MHFFNFSLPHTKNIGNFILLKEILLEKIFDSHLLPENSKSTKESFAKIKMENVRLELLKFYKIQKRFMKKETKIHTDL